MKKAIKVKLAAVAAGAMVVVTGLAVTGPAAAINTTAPGPDAAQFGKSSNRVDNPWFPQIAGSKYVYTGQKDGKAARDVVVVADKVRVISGIRAAVVKDRLFLDGKLAERTTDWYAQDRDGTVWYLGEDTATLDAKGHIESREGSFLNGRDGAKGGIFMPAEPRVGQSFQQEDYKGHAEDRFKVLAFHRHVVTPALTTDEAMLTKETTTLEPGIVDHKFYVRGIGTVEEQAVKGEPVNKAEHLSLASFRRG